MKYTCPCCGFKTFDREDHLWDICEVCYWESCPIGNINPLQISGPNPICLAEAQQNFIFFGACEKAVFPYTRMPLADETKDENFKTFDESKKGLKYVKRHWGETSADPKTDHWGVSTYYFEATETGEVLKQIIIYANGKQLKYSNLHLEDVFGGLAKVDLDITETGYKAILQNTFYNVWNIPIIEKNSKNKIHFSGWYLAVYNLKIVYPDPVFEDDEKLIVATLDNRFSLNLRYETNAKFVLEIHEGHTGIHYFNYMNWEEASSVTQKWINDITLVNREVDSKKTEEEKVFSVRVNIDNQIVISKLTTWRNMDWGVEKFRNIEIEVQGETFSVVNTFTDFENMLLTLQKSLPENHHIETCFFCRFSSYHVSGNCNFGGLFCFEKCKKGYLKINNKDDYIDFYEANKKDVFLIEETHYCNEFQRIKNENWAFKNKL